MNSEGFETIKYRSEGKDYQIYISERKEGNIEIYCKLENDEYITTYNFKSEFYYENPFKDVISKFSKKEVTIKVNNTNNELIMKFPIVFEFYSKKHQKYTNSGIDKFIEKKDFKFMVIKEKEDILVYVYKGKNYTFQFKKNDSEKLGWEHEVDDYQENINYNETIFFLMKGEESSILRIEDTRNFNLQKCNEIDKINLFIYNFEEKNKFGITELINNSKKENESKLKRINKIIKEIDDKKKEIESVSHSIKKNLGVMDENANLLIFPKQRFPNKKEAGFNFNSEIILKKNDFNLINNKLTQVYDGIEVEYELIYRASRDGDYAKILKKKCENVKGTLIVIQTDCIDKSKRRVFGGFTTQIWDDSERNYDDDKAFCFSINEKKIYDLKEYCSAIGCDKGSGPRFCWMIEIENQFMIKGGKVYRNEVSHYSGQNRDYELNDGEEFFNVYELEIFKIKPKN